MSTATARPHMRLAANRLIPRVAYRKPAGGRTCQPCRKLSSAASIQPRSCSQPTLGMIPISTLRTIFVIHSGTQYCHAHEAAIALSSREVNVLNQVARGLSNKQIALKLGISDKTVRNHLSRIFRKLDAGNRTQAVMNAMRVGLLTV